MGQCWASNLGGCDRMSGEHVFSNALFSSGCGCPPVVRGVKRIRKGEATPNAEKANILCRCHNSMLSPLDEVAGKIALFRANANDENFNESLFVEGELLERWLLKTVVNNAAAGWMGTRKWRPEPDVVSAIYGLSVVPNGIGLYSVDGIEPQHRPSGGVSVTPIFLNGHKEQLLGGAYITIHGMPLFAALNTGLAERIEAGEVPHLLQHFTTTGLRHLYHPGAIVMSREHGHPVVIGLSWRGYLRFADGTTTPFLPP